jgi:hypothetical protein
MAEENIIRQSVRLTRYATAIVRGRATEMWPELDENTSGLINKIIADWDTLRDDGNGGGRMARIKALEVRADDHERRIDRIERHLEVPYDADHA